MAKNKGLIAKASISINAPVGKVWDALTKPEVIKQYMFGTNVISDAGKLPHSNNWAFYRGRADTYFALTR